MGTATTRSRRRGALVILIGPFALLFLGTIVAPIGYAIYQSVVGIQRSGPFGAGGSSPVFVGLSNYIAALSDEAFVSSLGRVLVFALIQVPLMVVLAGALALLLDAASARGVRFFRTSYFLPYGVPGVIASVLWGFLYTPGLSPLLNLASELGVDVSPLSSGSILFAIANIVTWQFAGYNVLVLVAQLKSIDADLFEAARIDGANAWQVVTRIKVPLIRPALVLITVFTIIGSLQLFAEPLVLRPLSTAITSTFTPNLAAYNEAFVNNNYNLAAAQAVILALLAGVLSFAFLRIVNRKQS